MNFSKCLGSVHILVISTPLILGVGCSGSGSSSSTGGSGTTGNTPPPAPASNEWTWMSGSSMATGTGVYGTQGVASSTNLPPGRGAAVTWTDGSGNLWLFGGGQNDPLGTNGPLNDLWEYNPTKNEWTWINGSNATPGNHVGIYGTLDTPASANVPGGRGNSVSWMDANNNLFLFGGGGYDSNGSEGALGDLWKFNTASKEWTWVNGSKTIDAPGVYGTLGAPAAGNTPGARAEAVSWTDHKGNFWLFGGIGFGVIATDDALNDLWEYSPSSNEWTWMSGSTTVGARGVYGTLGIAAAEDVPGSRQSPVSWTDSSGNLWMFGGLGPDSTAGSLYDLNDLWEFNPSSNQWTWMGGSSTVTNPGPSGLCEPGVYGTKGTAASGNVPGGRNSAVSWTDSSGNFWLFGGLGCDATGTTGDLNDLWEFNPQTKMWTWQSGSNSVGPAQGGTGGPGGVYGTQGTAAASSVPGGRSASVSWVSPNGSLWLLGGIGRDSTDASGFLNDLWSYQP
jgi:N-acetylneuraminic acid mutarotase